MVSRSKLERAHAHEGVVAVMAMDAEQRSRDTMSWVGDERWQLLIREAARLRALSQQPQIRVLVGDHSILLMGDEHDVVGLVFQKGHPIVKSVVRMVRQLMRHAENGRRAAAKPTASAVEVQMPAAATTSVPEARTLRPPASSAPSEMSRPLGSTFGR